MKQLTWIGSAAGLVLTIVPPSLFSAGAMEESTMKTLMLVGVFVWFVLWPLALKGYPKESTR